MPSSNHKRVLSGVIVVLLIGVGIYFFTRPKQPTALPSAAPSASAAPRLAAAPRPSSTIALPAPVPPPPAGAEKLTVATLSPKGFAELAQLAKAEGYFDAEGLRVEIEHVKIATDLARDVSDHKYDFGITFDFSIAFTAFGKPGFRVLSEVAHALRPITVYARKDRGIAAPADLKGKRIGVQPFPNSHYCLSVYLEHHGMKEADVTVLEHTYEKLPTALSRGEIDVLVDCIASLRGAGWNLMKTPGLDLVDLSKAGVYPIRFGLIASDELVTKRPETVERFTRAIARSAAFMSEHHEKAVDDIAEALSIEGAKARKLTDSLIYEVSLEPAFIAVLEAQSRWFQDTGRNKAGAAAPSFSSLVYPDALRAVRPDAVTVPR